MHVELGFLQHGGQPHVRHVPDVALRHADTSLAAPPALAGAPAPARASILDPARFVGFTANQQTWITGVADRAPRAARAAIERVAPHITFRRGAAEEISQGDHTSTFVGTESVRFLVSLGPRTRTLHDALAAHMLMHELGHTVDNGLVGEQLRASFAELFARSPVWANCYPQPLGSSQRCVSGSEIFAEQFGFYGARDRLPRSLYGIPPLYRFREFGPLLERAVGGEGTLVELGDERRFTPARCGHDRAADQTPRPRRPACPAR